MIREHIGILYLFHSFYKQLFQLFKCYIHLTPIVKALFVCPTCQDKSSPSLSIDSIAAPKTVDCFFFSFFRLHIKGP